MAQEKRFKIGDRVRPVSHASSHTPRSGRVEYVSQFLPYSDAVYYVRFEDGVLSWYRHHELDLIEEESK